MKLINGIEEQDAKDGRLKSSHSTSSQPPHGDMLHSPLLQIINDLRNWIVAYKWQYIVS